jgi:hypothetical protein
MDEVLKRIRISPTKLGILQMNNDQRWPKWLKFIPIPSQPHPLRTVRAGGGGAASNAASKMRPSHVRCMWRVAGTAQL